MVASDAKDADAPTERKLDRFGREIGVFTPPTAAPVIAAPKEGKYKTSPCRHWATGFCQMGAACNYLHEGVDDVSGPAWQQPAWQEPAWQEPASKEPEWQEAPVRPPTGLSQSGGPAYKTKMCRHFEAGRCEAGPACNFSHGDAEYATKEWAAPEWAAPTSWQPSERPPTGLAYSGGAAYKTKICRHFEAGRCEAGPACNFSHGDAEYAAPAYGKGGYAAAAYGKGAPSGSYKTAPCRHYAEGKCERGAACNFLHEGVDYFSGKGKGGKGKDKGKGKGKGSAKQSFDDNSLLHALLSEMDPEAVAATLPGFRTKPCIHFAKGTCEYGDKCNFSHEGIEGGFRPAPY